jgi:hypothetical protein
VEETITAGTEFARALAEKDFERIRALMDPQLDFRGMTPRRVWEAGTPDELIGTVLRQWFEDSDDIRALEHLETDMVVDRERIGYRFSVRNQDGEFLVEQQAYLEVRDGRISWMRVLCSGYRPVQS